MAKTVIVQEDILAPISADQPCGVDLRFAPEWKRLEEARRSDDGLTQGAWQAKEQKSADWDGLQELAAELLQSRSKDLRIAIFLTEAFVRNDGLAGLLRSLTILRELITQYWDSGLLPLPEADQFQDRAAALEWLNEKLPEIILTIPVTFRADGGMEYSYAQYIGALRVGREQEYESKPHEERERFQLAKQEGRCLDLFDLAVKASRRAPYENVATEVEAVQDELAQVGRVINEKFKNSEDAPGFSKVKAALEEIGNLIDTILVVKRKEEPDAIITTKPGGAGADGKTSTRNGPTIAWVDSGTATSNGNWRAAEELIRSGEVEKGLAEMANLAMSETSGRSRFQRKLLLSEICLQMNRERLARTILEELAEQIEKYKLDEWETTDIVGGVWGRLYRIYRKSDGDADKAAKLYDRLCRLDPWQTFSLGEG